MHPGGAVWGIAKGRTGRCVLLLRLSKKAVAFFDKRIAPCCSARNVRKARTLRTFAG